MALITGAARGQGAAEAERFAAEGAVVIAGDVLEAGGVVRLDVTDSASWATVVDAIVAEHGRIDVLVNNAGIYDTTGLDDLDEAGYRRILDVNLVGPFLGMKAVVPHMTEGGSIVNVSSLNGILATANTPAYTSSKFGLRGLTKATALELGPRGIRVNAILPGVIRTPMVAAAVEPREEGMAAALPLRRIGEPMDVAEAAVFLASDESGWITGTDLVIDGGHSATVPRLVSVERVDLVDPELYRAGVPRDYFRWLRDNEPVAWHDEADGPGYWVLSLYDDVVAANRDWQTYSNALKGSSIEEARSEEELAIRRMIFVNQDPPDHTRHRKLVSHAFTPGHVRRLTPLIEQTCSRLVDGLLDGEVHDFVGIAEELSFQMVATLFGVPESDWPSLLEITRELADFQDPEVNPGLAPRPEVQRAMFGYGAELVASVRADPDAHSGIVVELVHAEIEEDGARHRLSDAELAAFFPAVLVGGLSTTAHTMTEAVNTWVEQPGVFGEWRGRDCPPNLVEELLRWRGPVLSFRRTATVDHEVRGQLIRAGDKVLLSYASANRDERHFSDPDVFDPARQPLDHVAFGGGGPHFCIGAQLARLDLRLVLSELFRRVDRFEPAGEPVRLRANQFAGWLHYPVRAMAI